jgi:hypothetical protein
VTNVVDLAGQSLDADAGSEQSVPDLLRQLANAFEASELPAPTSAILITDSEQGACAAITPDLSRLETIGLMECVKHALMAPESE